MRHVITLHKYYYSIQRYVYNIIFIENIIIPCQIVILNLILPTFNFDQINHSFFVALIFYAGKIDIGILLKFFSRLGI